MFFRRSKIFAVILLLLTLIISSCSEKDDPEAVFDIDNYEGDLAVYFFHLDAEEKTGESILVKTPKGQTILIDAGTPEAGPLVDEHLDRLGIEKLDYVMPSHPHIDHIGGLLTIIKTKDIGKMIEIDIPHDTGTYRKYKELLNEENITVEIGEAGDFIELEDDLTLEIINPPKGTNADSLPDNYSNLKAAYINNVSMVMKLTYKEKSFLFTGDIYMAKELDLVEEYGESLGADVLVAPHHGDDTSSSNLFVTTVNPSIAMIPSNNMYSVHVFEQYEAIGSEVYHAAFNGTVVLVSDGKTIEAIPEKERENE